MAPALQPHRLRAHHPALLLHPRAHQPGALDAGPAHPAAGDGAVRPLPLHLRAGQADRAAASSPASPCSTRPLLARWRESALAAGLLVAHRRAGGDLRPRPSRAGGQLLPRHHAAGARRSRRSTWRARSPTTTSRSSRASSSSRAATTASSATACATTASSTRSSRRCSCSAPSVALLRRDRAMRLPLLWLGLYPLAPALMNEIPSASRGITGAPAFCLLAAIGAGAVLRLADAGERAPRRRLRPAGRPRRSPAWPSWCPRCSTTGRSTATSTRSTRRSTTPASSSATGRCVDYFRAHYDEYDVLVLTTRKSNQPDVFLRFYDGLRAAAADRRHAAVRAPREDARRQRRVVRSTTSPPGRRMLFAVLPEEVPLFADAEVKERVIAPDGSAAFVLVGRRSRLKDFVSTWRVAGLSARGRPVAAARRGPRSTRRTASGAARWRTYDKPAARRRPQRLLRPRTPTTPAPGR